MEENSLVNNTQSLVGSSMYLTGAFHRTGVHCVYREAGGVRSKLALERPCSVKDIGFYIQGPNFGMLLLTLPFSRLLGGVE